MEKVAVFWDMQSFHLSHSGLNVQQETVVFSTVGSLKSGNGRIIGDFGCRFIPEVFWFKAHRNHLV